MNQKQYHSLEELPLMMNMTYVAAALGISRAGAYKLAHSADFPAFQPWYRVHAALAAGIFLALVGCTVLSWIISCVRFVRRALV